jgi:membrane protease subunit HflK
VNQAQQEKERAINIATGEYNKVVPRAKGEADQKISAADGYATKRINEAEGDVVAFEAMLTEYMKAPAVTQRRIYLETMAEILPNVGKTLILDEDAKNILPLFNLGDIPSPIRQEDTRFRQEGTR